MLDNKAKDCPQSAVKMKKSVIVTTTVATRYELETEHIEALLTEQLKLPKDAQFNWHVGQWVSLDIITETTEDKADTIDWDMTDHSPPLKGAKNEQ